MSGSSDRAQGPCVVVGAGPVGLIGALALARQGVEVLVLEAEPEGRQRPGSRAIVMTPWTLWRLEEVLPGLGLRLGEAGIQLMGVECHYRSRRVFGMGVPVLHPLVAGTSLPQVASEAIFYEECVRHGVQFRWDAPVASVRTDGNGAMIELAGGEQIAAPYVIAADGARSAVRKSLGIAMDGHTDDVPFIIVDVDEHPDGSTPGLRTHFDYLSPALDGRNVMYMPFAGGMRVDIQCRPGDDAERMATRDGIREWMSKILDPWYGEHVQWVSTYRFQQVVADSYTDPHRRVLLAGEAAHLFAPFGGGRGLNSGVIDATDAASAIGRAVVADTSAASAGEIDAVAEDRRAAGLFNRDAAANALQVMRGDDPLTRAKRELAAQLSRVTPLAGAWLASIPPFGRIALRPGAATIY